MWEVDKDKSNKERKALFYEQSNSLALVEMITDREWAFLRTWMAWWVGQCRLHKVSWAESLLTASCKVGSSAQSSGAWVPVIPAEKGHCTNKIAITRVLGWRFLKKREKYVFLFASDIENSSIPTFWYRRDNYIFMITWYTFICAFSAYLYLIFIDAIKFNLSILVFSFYLSYLHYVLVLSWIILGEPQVFNTSFYFFH